MQSRRLKQDYETLDRAVKFQLRKTPCPRANQYSAGAGFLRASVPIYHFEAVPQNEFEDGKCARRHGMNYGHFARAHLAVGIKTNELRKGRGRGGEPDEIHPDPGSVLHD